MEDEGWVGEGSTEEYALIQERARIKWTKSREYGIWKFREDSITAKEIIETLRLKEKSTRKAACRVRGLKRKKKEMQIGATGSQPIILDDEDMVVDLCSSQRTEVSPDPPSTPIVFEGPTQEVLVAASSTPIQTGLRGIPTPTPSGGFESSQEFEYQDLEDEALGAVMDSYDDEIGK